MTYIYIYRENVTNNMTITNDIMDGQTEHCQEQLSKAKPVQIEAFLDKKTDKRTRNNEHYEYIVKWKGLPIEEFTCIMAVEFNTSWIGVHEQSIP